MFFFKLTVVLSVDEYNKLIKQKQDGLIVHRPIEVDLSKKPDAIKRPGGLPQNGVIKSWAQMIDEALMAAPGRQELVENFSLRFCL